MIENAEQVVETYKYQDENVIMVPYIEEGVSPYFGENFLFWLHNRCKAQHLLDILFPGMPTVTLASFIAFFLNKPIMVGFKKGTLDVLGFGFLFEIEGKNDTRKATVGFCFFRDYWGSPLIRSVSRLTLRYWFCEAKISIIFGTTLWRNRLAWRFARQLGFDSVGRVPKFFCKNGKMEDMHLMFLEREKFLEGA